MKRDDMRASRGARTDESDEGAVPVSASDDIRVHAVVAGLVQGVGFRYKACYSAKNRGVTGWGRKCSDGTVEMEAEGYPADIAAVIRELDEHSWGNIERIESENIPLEGGYGFEIR